MDRLAMLLCFLAASACSSAESPPPKDGGSDASVDARLPKEAGDSDATMKPDAGHDAAFGPPLLLELSVSATADSSPPIRLVPPFSSHTHDYYVRCDAGKNALTIAMSASPGSESELLAPTKSGTAPKQSLSRMVDENQAIVAVATDGTSTTQYWVRCLPHDFPTMKMKAHPSAGTPPPGYYLVGTDRAIGGAGYGMVLDGNGVPVWYYKEPTGSGVIDVDSMVNGTISFVPASFTAFEVHQLSPPTTAYLMPPGTALSGHELRALSNGHYLIMTTPRVNGVDLTGLSVPLPDGGTEALGPDAGITDCDIVEVDPTGMVFWRWKGIDHFDPAQDSTWPRPKTGGPYGSDDGGSGVIDVFHCNSVDVDPTSGNLLVSARHMDSIFYIDRSTGAVLWKMGGAAFSKDGATYVPVADPFFRQHDARLQPGWSPTCSGGRGQVSVFDDRTAAPGLARGVLYDVTVGGDGGLGCDGGSGDGGSGGATVAWQYYGEQPSAAKGSFRITSDGSRIIGWGDGAPGLVFTEVDVAGNDLVDFYYLNDASSYRAIKVPLSAFDLDVLRNTAGSTW